VGDISRLQLALNVENLEESIAHYKNFLVSAPQSAPRLGELMRVNQAKQQSDTGRLL